MDWTAGPGAPLGFPALVLLLPLMFCPAGGDAHSLCYNFTIDPQPRPGEPWCVVQGQVDENVFLSYDCGGAKIQSTGPLGEEVKATHTWEIQTETLRDIGDFLKGQLSDVILEKHTARENGRWSVGHSGWSHMKEKWENDRAVTDFLQRVSMGDCRAWCKNFMVRWEEMLKSTASPTSGPPAVQPTATAIGFTIGIAVGVAAGFGIIILGWIIYKMR